MSEIKNKRKIYWISKICKKCNIEFKTVKNATKTIYCLNCREINNKKYLKKYYKDKEQTLFCKCKIINLNKYLIGSCDYCKHNLDNRKNNELYEYKNKILCSLYCFKEYKLSLELKEKLILIKNFK